MRVLNVFLTAHRFDIDIVLNTRGPKYLKKIDCLCLLLREKDERRVTVIVTYIFLTLHILKENMTYPNGKVGETDRQV